MNSTDLRHVPLVLFRTDFIQYHETTSPNSIIAYQLQQYLVPVVQDSSIILLLYAVQSSIIPAPVCTSLPSLIADRQHTGKLILAVLPEFKKEKRTSRRHSAPRRRLADLRDQTAALARNFSTSESSSYPCPSYIICDANSHSPGLEPNILLA